MRAPEYGPSSDPAPTYAPASDPILTSYSDSSDVFGGNDGPNSTTLISAAISLQFVGPAPLPQTVSTPSSQPAPVSSSPVSAPAPMQPQIIRTTNTAQSKGKKIMAGQVNGTVTQVAPLRVVVDGATVDSLANVLDGATYLLNARVLVQLRNPQIPIVLGVVT